MFTNASINPAPSNFGQRPYRARGQPPTKRAKGNPIITRYPPPPGYQAPTQPLPSVAPSTWQPINHHETSYNATYPSDYPSATYDQSQPMLDASSTTLATTLHQHSHSVQTLPPTSLPCDEPTEWQDPLSASHVNSSAVWVAPPQFAGRKFRRQNSVPYLVVPSSGPLLDGNGELMSPLEAEDDSAAILEDDYDGECYFSRHPDEIDPNLSLGLIEWKAPQSTVLAIPTALELADLATPETAPMDLSEESDSVSHYFARSKKHEVLLGVRQTEAWHEMKDDLIFRQFSNFCSRLVSFAELQARYRRRYDQVWADGDHLSVYTQEFGYAQPPSREATPSVSDHMDIDETHVQPAHFRSQSMEPRSGNPGHPVHTRPRPSHTRTQSVTHARTQQANHSRAQSINHSRPQHMTHSRSNSATSQRVGHTTTSKLTRPKPLPLVHDQAQEDILAALGVTGSARQVYETPGPAFGPPPPEKGSKLHSRTNSMSSTHSNTSQTYRFPAQRGPSAPPTSQSTHTHDRWSSSTGSSFNAAAAPFATPTHTRVPAARGPDFSPITEDDFTPRPKYPSTMMANAQNRGGPGAETTRKRSYADSLLSGNGGGAADSARALDGEGEAFGEEDGGLRRRRDEAEEEEESATPKPRKQLRV